MKWSLLNKEEVINELDTDIKGLSNKEALKRLEENGYNILPKAKEKTILSFFLEQLKNPMVIILIITAVFSITIGEIVDSIFIFVVIICDAILGTIQEWRANKNASNLENMIKVMTNVIRDNKEIEIESTNLVKGDIIALYPGNKISADIRIIESHNLTIDESFLTGETIAAHKNSLTLNKKVGISDQTNMGFAGSTVLSGRAIGIVVATKDETEIGSIAKAVLENEDTKTPLTIRMEKFSKQIGMLTAIIGLILTIILYIKGFTTKEIFFSVVALSISAIPEGLPVVLTIALSIATNKMAKKNVIVKKLNSVEGLGSCTVIASDKTGTLTLNEQTAKIIVLPNNKGFKITGQGYNGKGFVENSNNKNILEIGKLGSIDNEAYLEKINNCWIHHGDDIDIAFLSLAYKLNIKNNYKILGRIPYESEKKYSATFYEENNKTTVAMKGSVETVLECCNNILEDNKIKDINKDLIINQANELASNGYRVIAIAKGEKLSFSKKNDYNKNDIDNLSFVGLVGFIDPIRKEAPTAINECHKAGIKVVMITGDHPLTALAIAKDLKLTDNISEVATGNDIEKYLKLGKNKLDEFISKTLVFARVTPNQKLEIIESYKRMGEFVAVTGDGVNDAPAMKSANIGIAMGSGTDIAKETGAMIITDDNFSSIVKGVEEGRNAYNNIRKVIYLLISCGLAEVLFFTLSIIFNLPMPLVAVQLLWLNLVTDGIQDVALAFEKSTEDVMKEKPRNPNESIFNKKLIQEVLLSGFIMGLMVFLFWIILLKVEHLEVNHARSYILLLMVFMQNVHVFNCRSEYTSTFKISFKNNPFIVIAVLIVLTIQLIVSETNILSNVLGIYPINFGKALIAFSMTIPLLLTMEIYKKRKNKE